MSNVEKIQDQINAVQRYQEYAQARIDEANAIAGREADEAHKARLRSIDLMFHRNISVAVAIIGWGMATALLLAKVTP